MGCDIHAAIEYKEGGVWKAVMMANRWYKPEYSADEPMFTARLDLNRNYNLFAILANVGNAGGFAGIKTGEGYNPITSDRGLPEDISAEARETGCTGDHSDTWVGLQEILDCDWQQTAVSTGLVTSTVFEQWDRMREWEAQPKSWCGDVSGAGIRHVSNEEMREYVKEATKDRAVVTELNDLMYTKISWTRTYAEEAMQIWTRILPVMLPLGRVHGYANVRMVMNFDS